MDAGQAHLAAQGPLQALAPEQLQQSQWVAAPVGVPAAPAAPGSAPSAFLRLRGLPFSAQEQDIRAFFGPEFELAQVFVCKRNGEEGRCAAPPAGRLLCGLRRHAGAPSSLCTHARRPLQRRGVRAARGPVAGAHGAGPFAPGAAGASLHRVRSGGVPVVLWRRCGARPRVAIRAARVRACRADAGAALNRRHPWGRWATCSQAVRSARGRPRHGSRAGHRQAPRIRHQAAGPPLQRLAQ